ncbi:MarR family EPS-associated transcriptional regulator [Aliarcobacter skirrowii]|uniref:MarR family EPS-associated transcriptional regulator n=1 Tax=Aliarcobacter skirrowii TaxID=28200 RepID=UPI0009EE8574|nr:MarR family EPS-associated transcriptional regulator [Aliarcobacter skirrowii]
MNQEEIELKILRSVDKVTSQRTIADEIGYSLGKVNYVLKNLIDKGLIKTQRFVNSENKIQYKYLLTPKGIKEKIEITEKFIAIKNKQDILDFVEKVIMTREIKKEHISFLEENILKYFSDIKPSEQILKVLKLSLY